MNKINYIDRSQLQTGDVFCTTDMSIAAILIRIRTWGIFAAFDTSKGTHSGIVSRENEHLYLYEMTPTKPRLRYVDVNSRVIIDPDDYNTLHPNDKEIFRPIIVKTGLAKTQIEKYENDNNGEHFTFVGRHPAFATEPAQNSLTFFLQRLYDKGIPYDWDEIFDFITGNKDADSGKDICSRLVWRVFNEIGIPIPNVWVNQVSPADWQQWFELKPVNWKMKGV